MFFFFSNSYRCLEFSFVALPCWLGDVLPVKILVQIVLFEVSGGKESTGQLAY